MDEQPKESEIKAALIDHLIENGTLDNAVLINEMVIANWSRRVDLAVANGKLHAYEIKSDSDTLKRLNGQLHAYLARFDKTTVVCAPRFTKNVINTTPNFVEVVEVEKNNSGISFRTMRRGALKIVRDKEMLISFLLKPELAALAELKSLASNLSSRKNLEEHAMSVSIAKLRQHVLECLKRRYQTTYFNFLSSRQIGKVTATSDLEKLSKSKLERQRASISISAPSKSITKSSAKRIDWEKISMTHGDLPAGAPTFVLKRQKVS